MRGRRLHQPAAPATPTASPATSASERQLRPEAERPALCRPASECASGFCVDGVCCDQACAGACRSCALPSSLGHAARPSRRAPPIRATSASTAGAGHLRHRRQVRRRRRLPPVPDGHRSAPPSTARPTSTRPPRPAARPATAWRPTPSPARPSPATAARCFGAARPTPTARPGNVCSRQLVRPEAERRLLLRRAPSARRATAPRGSAAPPPAPAPASRARCRRSMGLCTNVAAGQPRSRRDLRGPRRLSLRHERQVPGRAPARSTRRGRPARAASCPAERHHASRPAATCDGAGTCVTPAPTSCFPFSCGAAACKSTCAADADCAPPATSAAAARAASSPTGAVLRGTATSAQSGDLRPGRLLRDRLHRAPACRARWSAALGTCTPVPAGGTRSRPGSAATQGAASCGTTGFCDGAGGCQLYAAGTQCAPPSCPTGGDDGDAGAHLRRRRHLQAGRRRSRAAPTPATAPPASPPAAATATARPATSATPARAARSARPALRGGTECDSGNCVDGVCCSSASCGTCQSCNVAGQGGHVPAGRGRRDGAARRLRRRARPAGSTAPATAPAPAGTRPPAPAAAPPPAAGRPSRTGRQLQRRRRVRADRRPAAAPTCAARRLPDDLRRGRTTASPATPARASCCTNLKPNGAACVVGDRVHQRQLHRRVCCCDAEPCGSCNSCASPASVGTCPPVAAGDPDPPGSALTMASVDLRHRPALRRRRPMRQLSGRDDLRGRRRARGRARSADRKCGAAGPVHRARP